MKLIDTLHLDDGLTERRFTLDDVPGILWTPTASEEPEDAVPVILLGHPGGLEAVHPRLLQRARSAARSGFASAALELPGGGDRPRIPELETARADLRAAMAAGEPLGAIVDRLVVPLVDRAVPELQALLDSLLRLPQLREPVGLSGGLISLGIRLALVEPRIVAAGLFAGTFVPAAMVEEARRITIALHVLLQWDDESHNRQEMLDLFDAFGSTEKTLYASLGGHTGVPAYAGEDVARFFERHLR
ncbi:MAG: alpha/beta hydrolase [Candidatus Nanopelagicales bacterium]